MDKAMRNSPVKEALEMARRYGYEKGYAQGVKDAKKDLGRVFMSTPVDVELLIPVLTTAVRRDGFDGESVDERRAKWTHGGALLDRLTKFMKRTAPKKAAKRRA